MGFDGTSLISLLEVDIPKKSPEKPVGTGWEDRIVVTDSQRLANPVKWRKSSAMSSRWRLIDGNELYDMRLDSGQAIDVAADHPGEEIGRAHV